MNRILSQRPALKHGAFVYGMPLWLTLILRVGFFVFALVAAALAWNEWSTMPFGAKALLTLLAPAMLLLAAWPRPWRRTTLFVADETGMFFPNNSLLVVAVGTALRETWLFVPWSGISGLRLARERGDHAKCVAFDAAVTEQERGEFFGRVDSPTDRSEIRTGTVAAAYSNWPPSAETTLRILIELQTRNKT